MKIAQGNGKEIKVIEVPDDLVCPIKPLQDKVIFLEIVSGHSKLYLPESAKGSDDDVEIRVFAVGPGRLVGDKLVPMTIKVGDRITAAPNSPIGLHRVKGIQWMSLSEPYIAGVINEA